ncbi:MAG: isopentenyl-diphosphate Delta-isomerase [Proteobacteria bacterium]|nr:isopentenyl-diphosphate Delta-isomerase [Pseudomonadota bacterium]MDA0992130.1 isopentenyl-diphosphate Delta-isomerase [Pseudomonadota bacterium]
MIDTSARIVSSENESLILVDEHDNETGLLSKADCHDGDGILHRAFSVFLFNSDGELLLQQRARGKRLWPMYWSNSCCSHPRQGESIALAATRRLQDELHAISSLEFVYKFSYQAKYLELGSEHELCHVFLGRLDGSATPNRTEIEALRFISVVELEEAFRSNPEIYTPWFKMEWQRLTENFAATLARYTVKN